MIWLITGASHTGKTCLAQRLLEKHHVPYLSMDHLKMGLIRAGHTHLTPTSPDEALTAYLWPIVREMVKTAIENHQSMVVEGCYIPLNWAEDFAEDYLRDIRFVCLVMTEQYIRTHWEDIRRYANVVENRLCDDCTMEELIVDNLSVLAQARKHGVEVVLMDEAYQVNVE